MKLNIIELESIDSTNKYAKENSINLPLPSVIIANEQTQGRGRFGREFYSPAGTGLYMSLLFEVDDKFDLITPAVAVCVCESIEKLTGKAAGIKWVNDLYMNGRKICGILCERFEAGGKTLVCAGIGINITTESFPAGLTAAGSIGDNIDKTALAKLISEKILELNNCFNRNVIIDKYKSRLFITGKEITYILNGAGFSGTVTGINSDCNLIVKNGDGSESVLNSGEISLKVRM